jgi:hypothetical protein
MNTQLCIGPYEKAFAEYLGGSRVRYTWKCGHTKTETLMVGPKGRGSRGLRKPMSPDMVKKMAAYWGHRDTDGRPIYTLNAGPCPTCLRIKQRTG